MPRRSREPYEEFIQRYASFETGQLVGTLINLTLADVPKAIERLEQGFAFVGLQEEWEIWTGIEIGHNMTPVVSHGPRF